MIEREYKDRLFCFIFGNEAHREWTLSLYNAINNTRYKDPSLITITTLREVIYMGMRDDVAFVALEELNLYEQQSSFNPNMPLRLMQYTGNLYEKLITLWKKNKYGTQLISLPVPRLVVFYNGTSDQPDEQVLRLSDSFPEENRDKSDITVRVSMVNINRGKSPGLMSSCQPLKEYAWLVDRVRVLEKQTDIERALDTALDEMPDHYELKPFLMANRVEVKKMLLTEYDERMTMEMFKEEGRAEGRAEGHKLGLVEGSLNTMIDMVRSLKTRLGMTDGQAREALNISDDDWEKISAKV